MNGFIELLLQTPLGDPKVVLTGFVVCLVGGVMCIIINFAQAHEDVRRRSEAVMADRPVASKAQAKGSPLQAFNKIIDYFEASVANQNAQQTKMLRMQLTQAGFYSPRAVPIYFAMRVVCAIVFALIGMGLLPLFSTALPASTAWLYAGFIGAVGYFMPGVFLSRRIERRIEQHRQGFPDFMDLMVVCAEAGLSMEASIERIARELVDGYPSLAENLYMVSLEMRAGKSFTEAIEQMGKRLGIEEATMLATLLQQSSELGASLSQSLRVYSDEMRHKRMSRAEEKAYSLPAKLVVPLTLFVFPVLIITLMMPAVLRIAKAFPG